MSKKITSFFGKGKVMRHAVRGVLIGAVTVTVGVLGFDQARGWYARDLAARPITAPGDGVDAALDRYADLIAKSADRDYIARLDSRTRLALLQKLDSVSGIQALYDKLALESKFRFKEQARANDLAAWLSDSAEIVAHRAAWPGADDEQRKQILLDIMAGHSRIFGQHAIGKIYLDSMPANKSRGMTVGVTQGSYNWLLNRMTFNTHPDAGWDDFDATVSTAIHENTHRHQALYVQACKSYLGRHAAETTPDCVQPMVFGYNMSTGIYFDGASYGYDIYADNPIERHARFISRYADEALRLNRRREEARRHVPVIERLRRFFGISGNPPASAAPAASETNSPAKSARPPAP